MTGFKKLITIIAAAQLGVACTPQVPAYEVPTNQAISRSKQLAEQWRASRPAGVYPPPMPYGRPHRAPYPSPYAPYGVTPWPMDNDMDYYQTAPRIPAFNNYGAMPYSYPIDNDSEYTPMTKPSQKTSEDYPLFFDE